MSCSWFAAAGETERDESGAITQNPTAPEVGSAPSREPLQPRLEEEGGDLELKGEGSSDSLQLAQLS